MLVAAGLWVMWLGPGAVAEYQSVDGSAWRLAAYGLPLLIVAGAVVWDHPAGRLGVVPVSFVPGLALLPDAEWAALSEPVSVLVAAGTFAVYLVVAAAGPDGAGSLSSDRIGEATGEGSDDHSEVYRRFVAVRFGALGVVFCAIVYALYLDPSIAASFARLEGEQAARNQQLFTAVVVFFGWMVVLYTGAISPALNWERHRRRERIPAAVRELQKGPGLLRRRLVGWLGALVIVSLAAVFVLL